MKARARLVSTVVVVLAASLALVCGGSARPVAGASPTIYVVYAMNCTFNIVDDNGKIVSAIAPGSYQLDVRTPIVFGTVPMAGVNDLTACRGMPQFQFTGPGVNLFTTMTAGCEMDKTFPVTLQPNATYTATDQNQPTVAHATFTTLASGTPQAPPVTYTSTGNGKTYVSTSVIGEDTKSVKGTLTGSVSAAGLLTLKSGGKPVSTLVPGRYSFAIVDQDPKASFMILGPKSTAGLNLTGVKFVGKKALIVKLTAGRWTFYSPSLRNVHYFVVKP
jgi:hypothetical protein